MRPRLLPLVLVVVGLVAACAPPQDGGPQTVGGGPTPTPSPTASASPDPDEVALGDNLDELRRTLAATRAALEATAAGEDRSGEALALLVAEPAAVTGGDPGPAPGGDADGADDDATNDATVPGDDGATDGPPAPLLPGPEVSREETISYGDLLTTLLASARGAGAVGEPVQRLLADPLAGDLGTWQQAPGDLLALVDRITTDTTLAAAETAVLELDGEATRALAWTTLAVKEPALAADAAERALAHLAIIDLALERLAG